MGYLLATAISEDDKLNLAALLSAVGFGCYFVEDRMRGLEGEAAAAGALGGKVVLAATRPPPVAVAVGARLLDSLLFNNSDRCKTKNGHSLRQRM